MNSNNPRAAMYAAFALVAGLTLFTIERAFAVAGVPNAIKTTYTIPSGPDYLDFTLAARDMPVLVSFAGIDSFRGSATLTLCNATKSDVKSLSWNGTSTMGTDGTSLSGSLLAGYAPSDSGAVVLGYVAYRVQVYSIGGERNLFRMWNSNRGAPAQIVVVQIW